MNKVILVIFILLLTTRVVIEAAETNQLYQTIDAYRSYRPHSEGIKDVARESLPAIDFPEGNWGQAVGGCQASLRFDKTIYTNGEPIVAVLLLRNVTNQDVSYKGTYGGPGCIPIDIQVTSDSGNVFPEYQMMMISQSVQNVLKPGTQDKHIELLNDGYNLTNGTYLVHSVVKVVSTEALKKWFKIISADENGGKNYKLDYVEIKSADAKIIITNAP